ncbi:MAG: hypothetical protein AVDCRST_MAG64-3435, partial [uncultured Phycisphaerae bacterium]
CRRRRRAAWSGGRWRGEPEETGLALVLCTGAALRRPSAWPAMPHNEGWFRTA